MILSRRVMKDSRVPDDWLPSLICGTLGGLAMRYVESLGGMTSGPWLEYPHL